SRQSALPECELAHTLQLLPTFEYGRQRPGPVRRAGIGECQSEVSGGGACGRERAADPLHCRNYHLDVDGSDDESFRGGIRSSHFRANSVAISLILAIAAVAVLSAALWAARAASRLRTLSNASIGVLGFTMRSFLRLRLGEMSCVFSRVNTSRRSMSPHSKHSSVWCSKPRTGMAPSCTTCVTYISAAHIKHRIAIAPFQRGVRRTHPSCVSFEDQARVASRQAAPPLSHV